MELVRKGTAKNKHWHWSTLQQISPETLVYFTLTEKPSGTVRFPISTEAPHLEISGTRSDLILKTFFSYVGYDLCPRRQELLQVNNACCPLSQLIFIKAPPSVCHSIRHFWANQATLTLKCLWKNAMGQIMILPLGFCCLRAWASPPVVILCFLWAYHGEFGIVVSRILTWKPACMF